MYFENQKFKNYSEALDFAEKLNGCQKCHKTHALPVVCPPNNISSKWYITKLCYACGGSHFRP